MATLRWSVARTEVYEAEVPAEVLAKLDDDESYLSDYETPENWMAETYAERFIDAE